MTFAKHIDAARDSTFQQFINRIRLEYIPTVPIAYFDSENGRPCFSNIPTMSVESVVQKTKVRAAHRWRLINQARAWFKSTPFVLEITKYEYFDVKALAASLPIGVEITLHGRPLDERIGAALFDPRWQSLWA